MYLKNSNFRRKIRRGGEDCCIQGPKMISGPLGPRRQPLGIFIKIIPPLLAKFPFFPDRNRTVQ